VQTVGVYSSKIRFRQINHILVVVDQVNASNAGGFQQLARGQAVAAADDQRRQVAAVAPLGNRQRRQRQALVVDEFVAAIELQIAFDKKRKGPIVAALD
jgi:hypothetical protein